MIVNNLENLKVELQKVLVSEGFIDFCKDCPVHIRCCNHMKPTCDHVINKVDCAGSKPLDCYFYVCPILNEKNKEINNWLMRVRESINWPNKLEFPFELEEFSEKFRKKGAAQNES